MSRKEEKLRVDIYARITEKIVADLEKGVRPWMQPWRSGNAIGRVTRPLRHNGLPYSGMNVLLLWSEAMARGYVSPVWMTFKQAIELGGAVRKGETGSMVVFASRFTKAEADGHGGEIEREIPVLERGPLTPIAALGHVMGNARKHNAGKPSHAGWLGEFGVVATVTVIPVTVIPGSLSSRLPGAWRLNEKYGLTRPRSSIFP